MKDNTNLLESIWFLCMAIIIRLNLFDINTGKAFKYFSTAIFIMIMGVSIYLFVRRD